MRLKKWVFGYVSPLSSRLFRPKILVSQFPSIHVSSPLLPTLNQHSKKCLLITSLQLSGPFPSPMSGQVAPRLLQVIRNLLCMDFALFFLLFFCWMDFGHFGLIIPCLNLVLTLGLHWQRVKPIKFNLFLCWESSLLFDISVKCLRFVGEGHTWRSEGVMACNKK